MCTQLYVVGAADSVLIRVMSLSQSVLYRELTLYTLQLSKTQGSLSAAAMAEVNSHLEPNAYHLHASTCKKNKEITCDE